MVDFGALTPEVNSARMYAGPGSSSLQTAASAWNGLAAELQSAAQGYETVITQLSSDEWTGAASASMASAAQPYVEWLNTTAAQAEQAATQARAAAAAHEQAFAATVPPPLIAANRAQTAAAVQANVFGQYTPLIAQLEAQYSEMWAQDSAAMYGYAGQSAAAAQVTPFTSPAATTNPAGTAAQSAAVSSATGTSAATSSQTILQELTSSMPTSLQSLSSPTSAATSAATTTPFQSLWSLLFGTTVIATNLSALVTSYSPYAALFYNTEGLPYFSVGMGNFGTQIAKSAGMLGGALPAAVPPQHSAAWVASEPRWAAALRIRCPPFRAAPVRSANWRCRRRGPVQFRRRPHTACSWSAASALPRRPPAPVAGTCSAVCRWPVERPVAWAASAHAMGSNPR